MKKAEVKGLNTKELKEKIDAETASLNQMKINHSISPLDNPAQIGQLRRTIARLKTELHQREQQTNN
ncbi:MAG: 50S ribosomal protein L29 [Tannerella sp.]|jgi:large subunit ribosomal protein L29|nr:50S ribosomal protein L29 [Tannerella sp.]